MKLSRNLTIKLNFIFDNIIPVFLRDTKWFMFPFFKIVFGNKTKIFLNFKTDVPYMSEKEYIETYKKTQSVLINRETDLNDKCINEILKNIKGESVLDVGCGRGFLARKLSKKYTVIATDIVRPSHRAEEANNIEFVKSNIEALPFRDKQFDTVICAHTLEHVRDLFLATKEIKRVARQRLIIVVPLQRPYKYTFDLHLHFFPYPHSFLLSIKRSGKNVYKTLGGDLFYMEDITK